MIAKPNAFNRPATPPETTGVRSVELFENSQTGELVVVHATPASTKGVISSGGNAIVSINPSPRAPKSGILNSMFTVATLLPNNRSNSAQVLAPSEPPTVGVHSSGPNVSNW